jgi:hypothetical protein
MPDIMDKDDVQHVELRDLDKRNELPVLTLEVPQVTWWKHKGLRQLYLMVPVLFLSATTNGYDSSLLNGLQTLTPWQECTFPSRLLFPCHMAC